MQTATHITKRREPGLGPFSASEICAWSMCPVSHALANTAANTVATVISDVASNASNEDANNERRTGLNLFEQQYAPIAGGALAGERIHSQGGDT